MSNPEGQNNYVYPFNSSGPPVWVWGAVLALLFFLFVIGIYFASKGPGLAPQISARQIDLTGGWMGTPGAV